MIQMHPFIMKFDLIVINWSQKSSSFKVNANVVYAATVEFDAGKDSY